MAVYTGFSTGAQTSILDNYTGYKTRITNNEYKDMGAHFPRFPGFSFVHGGEYHFNSNGTIEKNVIKGCPRHFEGQGRSGDEWVSYETPKYKAKPSDPVSRWIPAGELPQFTNQTAIFELDGPTPGLWDQLEAIWTITYSSEDGLRVKKEISSGGLAMDDTYAPSFFKDKVTPKNLIFIAQAGGGMGTDGGLLSLGRGGGAGAFGAFIVDMELTKQIKITVGAPGGFYGTGPTYTAYRDSKHIKVYLTTSEYLVLTLGGGKGGASTDNGGTWSKSTSTLWGTYCYYMPVGTTSTESFYTGAHGRLDSNGESQSKTFYSTYNATARSNTNNKLTRTTTGGTKPGGGASFWANGGNANTAGTFGAGGGGGSSGYGIGKEGGQPLIKVFY